MPSCLFSGGSQLASSPTAAPTAEPTAVATPVPTVDIPSASSGSAAQLTQQSPAPVAGLIAGIAVVALVLTRLRR